jgi:hypothetical protein
MDIKKKIALIAAGSVVSAGALFAVITNANAADTSTPTKITAPTADSYDANEANDPADANEANDPADAKEGNWAHDENDANDPADANTVNEGSEASGK